MAQRMATSGAHPLPQTLRIGYSSGNMGKSLQWNTVELFYLYYLTDILGLPPALAGGLIFLTLVWDGLSDPLAGFLVDRYSHFFKSYRRILACSIPFCALAFSGIFALPVLFPTQTIAAVLVAGLLFRIGYTFIDIAHNSLLANLTSDGHERTVLSAYRFFFSSVGTLLLLWLAAPVLRQETTAEPFVMFSVMVGVAYLLVMYTCVAAIGRRGQLQVVSNRQSSMGASFLELLKNRYLMWLSLFVILVSLFVTIMPRFAVFYSKEYLAGAEQSTYLVAAYTLGQLLSLPCWLRTAKCFGKYHTVKLALIVFSGASLTLLFAPVSFVASTVAFFIAGFAFAGINVIIWSLLPDAIDINEQLFGRRHEAFTFGIIVPLMKICAGISAALVGAILALTGYQGLDSEWTALGIKEAMSLLPLFAVLLAMIPLTRMKLLH